MRKLLSAALAVVCILACSLVLADNRVSSIALDVALMDDGSAEITQVWQADFDEGTECYIPIAKSGYLTITDFSVSDGDRAYAVSGAWDTKASFEEKAEKCGVVEKDDGYELCWGISSYGAHTYTVKYTVHDILGAYSDRDGFYFRFVNDKMNTTPTDISLTIRAYSGAELNEANSAVEARGFEGDIGYKDGVISIVTTEPIDSDGHVTVLLSLEKGIVHPARAVDSAFESLEHTYKGDEKLDTFAILGTLFAIAAVLIVPISVYSVKRKKAINAFVAEHGMKAEAPLAGFMPATALLGCYFDRFPEENLLLAALASLIADGAIIPSDEGKNVLRFVRPPKKRIASGTDGEPLYDYERELYDRLKTASEGGILSEKSLEKSLERHPALLTDYLENCSDAGERYLNEHYCFINEKKHSELKHLTPEGEEMLAEVTGLGLYFDSFSHMEGKSMDELSAFADLMPYALLYGVSEKAMGEFSSLMGNASGASGNTLFAARYAFIYFTCFTNSSSGGSVHTGGGGFSGGGSGGGTR